MRRRSVRRRRDIAGLPVLASPHRPRAQSAPFGEQVNLRKSSVNSRLAARWSQNAGSCVEWSTGDHTGSERRISPMRKTLITAALAAATLTSGMATSVPAAAAPWGVEPTVTRDGDVQLMQVQYRGS